MTTRHPFRTKARLPFCSAGLLMVALLPALLAAQTIGGRIVRSTDQAPIVGVVVLLIDGNEIAKARTLSDMDGRFELRAPAPGTYRVRTRRIGFTQTTGAPIAVRGDTTLNLALDQIPVILPSVTAEERASCNENEERGLATAILWEEARTAILAADITIRELDYRFEMMLHSRKMDMRPPPLLIESVFGRVRREGVQPWTSFPPDTLEARGYVTPTDSGLRYVAPDLTVLLSSYFTRAHCFRMRAAGATPERQVALEFWPAATIRRSEIKGVLLFDAESRALRTVEFSYVNLPETVNDTIAGGVMEFAQLTNGAWIIPRWLIRAPIPVRSALGDTVRRAGTAVDTWRSDYRIVPTTSRMRITGGDLLVVRQGGSPVVLWSRPTSTLEVRAVTRDGTTEEPAPGVSVAFAGSTEQEVTDMQGSVRFTGMVGGDYAIDVSTPYYSAFAFEPEHLRVSFSQEPRTAVHTMRVRTLLELARDACGSKPGHAVLLGSVARPGAAVVGAAVTARIPRGATSSLDEARTARARTTIDGRYAICEIPTGVEIFLTVVSADGTRVSHSTFIDRGEAVAFMDLAFPESPVRP